MIENIDISTVTGISEDLTVQDNVLKFKDRDYEPNTFSGKGYKILRIRNENCNTGNCLSQSDFMDDSTVYELRYDFDLQGTTIVMPKESVLSFKGGSLRNGSIEGYDTIISGYHTANFENIHFIGNFIVDSEHVVWEEVDGNNNAYACYVTEDGKRIKLMDLTSDTICNILTIENKDNGYQAYCTDEEYKKPLWYDADDDVWRCSDGIRYDVKRYGSTEDRPTENIPVGFVYFDTTLGRPVWFTGKDWQAAVVGSDLNMNFTATADATEGPVAATVNLTESGTFQFKFSIPRGRDGINAIDGRVVLAYKDSNTKPSRPTGGSINMNTGVVTYPSGWVSTPDEFQQKIWMSQGIFNQYGLLVGEWSDPICLSGADGEPGKDGTTIEFIFIRTTDNITPSTPQSIDQSGYIPDGWFDHPQGVDQVNQYEWVSSRNFVNGSWGHFSTPGIWSKWSTNGMDGDGVEYVFYRTTSEVRPSTPNSENTDDYVPAGWSDDPQGVTEYYQFEWCSQRKYNGTTKTWGLFSTPALWAKWSKDGQSGQDGNSIKVKYAVTDAATIEPAINRSQVNPGTLWQDSVPKVTGSQVIWRTEAYFTPKNELVGLWSDPVLISGTAGTAPGDYTEFRYRVNQNCDTPPELQIAVRDPENWTTTMPSVTKGYFVWMTSARIKGSDETLLTNWSTPIRVTPTDSQGTGVGGSNILLETDNDFAAVLYDQTSGEITSGLPITINFQMYLGEIQLELLDITNEEVNGVTITNDAETGSSTITAISASTPDAISIVYTVIGVYDQSQYSRTYVFNIVKISNGITPNLYQLQPSTTAIKVNKEGEYVPEQITCGIYQMEGSNIIEIDELPENLKITYQIDLEPEEEYTLNSQIESNIADDRIVFKLYYNDIVMDVETVSLTKDGVDGIDGVGSITIDLDNQTEMVGCDVEGNVISGLPAETNVFMYYGTEELSLDSVETDEVEGVEVQIADNKISVISISKDSDDIINIPIKCSATYNEKSYSKTTYFKITKVRPGLDGENAKLYKLIIEPSVIKVNKSGTASSSTVTCNILEINGLSSSIINTIPEGYTLVSKIDDEQEVTQNTLPCILNVGTATNQIEFSLKYNDEVYEQETVPVVSDGIDGINPVTLDLDNEMASIACDDEGNVLLGLPITVNFNMYNGTEELTITSITNDSIEGVTIQNSTENKSSTITSISKGTDPIYIKYTVVGSKDDVTYTRTAIFRIIRLRAGKDAVLYQLLPSSTAIKKDKSGNVVPESIKCNITKITADSTDSISELPSNLTIKYSIDSNAEQDYTLAQLINTDNINQQIVFNLYDNSTLIDIETIPVVSDGVDGFGSITIDLDNEMAVVLVDNDNTVLAGLPIEINFSMYFGTDEMTITNITHNEQPYLTISDSASESKSTITAIQGEQVESIDVLYNITGTYQDTPYTRSVVFKLVKMYAGQNGQDAVVYQLVPQINAIKCTIEGSTISYNTQSISCGLTQSIAGQVNNVESIPVDYRMTVQSDKTSELTYLLNSTIGLQEHLKNPVDNIIFRLYYQDILCDIETIPVVKDGTDGEDGQDAVIPNWYTYVYKQSDTKPNKPTGSSSMPEGWVDIPDSDDNWWQCIGEVDGTTNLVISWSEVLPVNGKPGEAGRHYEFRFAQNGSSTVPPSLSTAVRNPSGWTIDPPTLQSGYYMWMTMALINNDDTLNGIWSTPTRISGERGEQGERGPQGIQGPAGEPGASIQGQPGISFEIRYSIGDEDSPNASSSSYNLGLRYPTGWSLTMPNTTSSYPYIWAIQTRVDPSTNTIEDDWQLIRLSGINGVDGESGGNQIVYPAGIYSTSETYVCNEQKAPYVVDTSVSPAEYYVLNTQMSWGPSNNNGLYPHESDYWVQIEDMQAVYANIAIAPKGLLGSAVFYENYMFSQNGYRIGVTSASSHYEDFDPEFVGVLMDQDYKEFKLSDYGNSLTNSTLLGQLSIGDYVHFTDANRWQTNWYKVNNNGSGDKVLEQFSNVLNDEAVRVYSFVPSVCIDLLNGSMILGHGRTVFKNDGSASMASGKIKMNADGSGELADGGITWDTEGNLTSINMNQGSEGLTITEDKVWFSADMQQNGTYNGRSLRFYSADILCRGNFGALGRFFIRVTTSQAGYYHYDGTSGSYYITNTTTGGTGYDRCFYDNGTSIEINLYTSIKSDLAGIPFNVVLFDRSTTAPAREYIFVGATIGAVVYAVNVTDNQNGDVTGIYASGVRVDLQGGMAAAFMYIGSSYWASNTSASAAKGLGWVCLGKFDNGATS